MTSERLGGKARQRGGHRPGPAVGVKEPDLGHRPFRLDQFGLPVELVAPAVPTEPTYGQAFVAEPPESVGECEQPRNLIADGQGQVQVSATQKGTS